jgi:hypothetical protein
VVEGPAVLIEQQHGQPVSRRGVIRVGGDAGFEGLSCLSVLQDEPRTLQRQRIRGEG